MTSPRTTRPLPLISVVAAARALTPAAARAQDSNIPLPAADIERQMATSDFEVLRVTPSRGYNTERTYQLTLTLAEDGSAQQWKLAPAREGADDFNNRPEYELAPYVLQKLFLDEADYVVPPTVARAFPIDRVREIVAMAPGNPNPVEQTFREWPLTLCVVQYWLQGVQPATNEEIDDEDRFEEDEAFARHAANFNLLTYLIRHGDSNEGNFMTSLDPANPRIFSVDNGVAFSSEASDRGDYWRDLRFERFPASSIERLRALDLETLQRQLGVLAQLELQGGRFVPVEPGENLDAGRAIRRTEDTIQIGLEEGEIRSLHGRLTDLLERVDSGRYSTFGVP
ncbi:MAG: hypothetical protein R3195_16670 [Gemmatimonadota bacterium]|nr:hypothetical protein [Gemmatimonadota bacterium]